MSKPPVPEQVQRAVDMLNDPWDYEEAMSYSMGDSRRSRDDPAKRIRAHAEFLQFKKNRWVLYVEWDDSEPLYARNVVHRVIRECGLQDFVATGCSSNYDGDAEDNQKFPGPNVQVSYLKVGPTGRAMSYTCSECGETTGKHNQDISLSMELG